jgi:uncharacterized protein
MKILVLSDIHDNIWALKSILQTNQARECDLMICCGDLNAPFIIDLLATYNKPVHIVLGNNDCDVATMVGKLAKFPQIKIHGEYYRDEIGGKTIAVNHYPDKAQKLADLQNYDLVCYGHNHEAKTNFSGKTLMLNPGAVMGFNGRTLEEIPSSFMTYNTDAGEVQAFKILDYHQTGSKPSVEEWEEHSISAVKES